MHFLNHFDYARFRDPDTVLEPDQSIFYPGIVQAELSSTGSNFLILSADSFRDSLSFFLLSYAVADLVIDRFFRQVRVRRNIVDFHMFLSGFDGIRRDCVEELFRVQ